MMARGAGGASGTQLGTGGVPVGVELMVAGQALLVMLITEIWKKKHCYNLSVIRSKAKKEHTKEQMTQDNEEK